MHHSPDASHTAPHGLQCWHAETTRPLPFATQHTQPSERVPTLKELVGSRWATSSPPAPPPHHAPTHACTHAVTLEGGEEGGKHSVSARQAPNMPVMHCGTGPETCLRKEDGSPKTRAISSPWWCRVRVQPSSKNLLVAHPVERRIRSGVVLARTKLGRYSWPTVVRPGSLDISPRSPSHRPAQEIGFKPVGLVS